MQEKLKILLVEDSEADADLLVRHLKKEELRFEYVRVSTKQQFAKVFTDFNPDLIIADHNLTGFNGMEIFHLLKSKNKTTPFILVTGSISEKLLIEYAKEGIDDYILKNNLLRLPTAIGNVINKKKIQNLHGQLQHTNEKLQNVLSDLEGSIRYAKKIQDAMLPDPEELRAVFPGSFVISKPRDILSGDFYWFEKKDDFFLIAVADCTGHGVPGALLSMRWMCCWPCCRIPRRSGARYSGCTSGF